MGKIKDLTGQVFGRLTVVRRTENNVKNESCWICDCGCGTKNIVVIGRNLKNKYAKSCGCIEKELLVGQRFGKLIVVSRDEVRIITKTDKYREIYWLCQCDCGSPELMSVSTSSLRSGNTKSCGCTRGENIAEDITGMRFGRLTAIRRDEERVATRTKEGKSRKIYWLCQCECGNEKLVSTTVGSLKIGNTQSCGCLGREKRYESCKKYNRYDLTGDYGIGYTFKDEPFLFDLEDYDKIKDFCWYYSKEEEKYVIASAGNKQQIQMHRIILDTPEGYMPDHIYHVNYDNRKSELRLSTKSQNAMNMVTPINNTSGTKGVSWSKLYQSWRSEIITNGECVKKYFKLKDEAIKYRKKLEIKYHGDFAFKLKDVVPPIKKDIQ